MNKSILGLMKRFIKDESGQGTTEYVLLLFFVVMAVKMVGGTLQERLKGLVDKAFGKAESAVDSVEP